MGVQRLQHGKEAIDTIQIPDGALPLYPSDHNILPNCQIRKYAPSVRNISNPHPGNTVRRFPDDFGPQKPYATGLGRRESDDAPEGRGLSRSVPTQETDRFSLLY